MREAMEVYRRSELKLSREKMYSYHVKQSMLVVQEMRG